MATFPDNPAHAAAPGAGAAVWSGRILSGLVAAMLALDAIMKLAVPRMMIDNSPPLGLPADTGLYRTLGAILLASVALYVWPRTRMLGAILVTAYLGGAVAVNVRAGMPLVTNTLFGVYLGLAVWGGLYLRDPRLRALFDNRPTGE